MSRLPRYDGYKKSGVDWLGEIPSHWRIERNLGIFEERKETNQPSMNLLSVTINQGIIQQKEITTKKDSSNEDKSKYKVVKRGDLAYNKMRMWQGAIGASTYDGIVSPAYIILCPKNKIYSRYYHYLYRTPLFIKESNRHSYGLCDDMNSLRYEDFKTIYSPVPPPEDVLKITNFLDQKTAEIDEAIAKKEQLITLLQEQKAILINQAVTRGLNPSAPMKDSGVEWLGDIPAHWELKKLKYSFCEVDNRTIDGKETLLSLRMQEGLVPHNSVSDKPIQASDLIGYKKVAPGQVVMNRMRAAIGLFGVVTLPGLVSPDYAVFNVEQNIVPEFFLYLFKWTKIQDVFFLSSKGLGTGSAGFLRLYSDRFGAIYAPLPPENEQRAIAHSVNKLIADFNLVASKVTNEIDVLIEFKHSLISQVVTGKIKV